MFKNLMSDIRACMERDPAARNPFEVVILYAGFHAVLFYRLSNWLWQHRLWFFARWLSQVARWLTGIEIHPAAVIGSGFFIDHGHGVVIGETSEIGDNVTLYHDVTLGGVAPSVDAAAQRNQKRHPSLGNNVIVGSGAQILGPIMIHDGARVGANSVVLKDVAPGTTVVGIPAKVAGRGSPDAASDKFQAYGTSLDLTDPMQRIVDALLDKVQSLSMRVEQLEQKTSEEPDSAANAIMAEQLRKEEEAR